MISQGVCEGFEREGDGGDYSREVVISIIPPNNDGHSGGGINRGAAQFY